MLSRRLLLETHLQFEEEEEEKERTSLTLHCCGVHSQRVPHHQCKYTAGQAQKNPKSNGQGGEGEISLTYN